MNVNIAIHAFDFLPYLTGLENGRILAMRATNTLFPETPGGSDYFDDFISEISGGQGELTTKSILKTARFA